MDNAEIRAINASAIFAGKPLLPALAAIAEGTSTEGEATPSSLRKKLVGAEAVVCKALAERYRSNADTGKAHDMKGSGVMHKLSSSVVGTCLPLGQAKVGIPGSGGGSIIK